MNQIEIPLFPLRTVLFPEGLLPLRIFEPRYLAMVDAALQGELGNRIELSDKEGFFHQMSAGINNLLDSIGAIFQDAAMAMGLMAGLSAVLNGYANSLHASVEWAGWGMGLIAPVIVLVIGLVVVVDQDVGAGGGHHVDPHGVGVRPARRVEVEHAALPVPLAGRVEPCADIVDVVADALAQEVGPGWARK